MSQYSQTYGSFTRTSNYPLEADYIFSSEQELIDFYTDNEEATHLHRGLLKIVGEGNSQSLYWVVEEDGELVFKKLLEDIDRDQLYQEIQDLRDDLQEEITTREQEILELWGDEKENIISELNSIKKISEALNTEIIKLDKLHNEFNATVGTTDKDIIEYLKTLPYQSLTEVSNTLNDFLNKSSEGQDINTLPDLKDFLNGYTNADTLKDIVEALYDKIQGTPVPNLKTLRDIENLLIALKETIENREHNIQKELDDTQNGVGLNQDGTYSPDANSNYLQNSTSIVNALHILDNLIYTAIQEYTLEVSNEGNVQLKADKTLTGYRLSGNIKVNTDPNNQLIANSNGAYVHVDMEYNAGNLELLVNGNTVRQFNIGTRDMIHDAYYDTTTETIVILFKLTDESIETLRIPVGNLIREWEPDNSLPNKVVEIVREEVVNGADKVSADVRISDKEHNILKKDGNSLIVDGTTDSIIYNSEKLTNVVQNIQQNLEDLLYGIDEEINNRKAGDSNLSNIITNLSNSITITKQELPEAGYNDTYCLYVDGVQVGSKINILDTVLNNIVIKEVTELNVPYQGAQVGDKYIEYSFTGNLPNKYLPVSDLVIRYKEGNGISIGNDNTISSKVFINDKYLENSNEGIKTKNIDNAIAEAKQEVLSNLDGKAPIESPTFTGIAQVMTSPDKEDASQRIPSTNWVRERINDAIKEIEIDSGYSRTETDRLLSKKLDISDSGIGIIKDYVISEEVIEEVPTEPLAGEENPNEPVIDPLAITSEDTINQALGKIERRLVKLKEAISLKADITDIDNLFIQNNE